MRLSWIAAVALLIACPGKDSGDDDDDDSDGGGWDLGDGDGGAGDGGSGDGGSGDGGSGDAGSGDGGAGVDADGDGYTADEDCDDDDYFVNPGADETCDPDGVDEDCDGLVNDADPSMYDSEVWWADDDEDGFGDPLDSVEICEQPDGYVDNGDDCDDNDADVGAERDWYRDADDDDFGDEDKTAFGCEPGDGYTGEGGDCDDDDDDVHPGATEVCNEQDDDCDDDIDEGVVPTWYSDNDRDGWGDGAVASCDQPPDTADRDGDCDDSDPDINPGEDERCNGVDDDCDEDIDEDDAVDASTWYADDDGDLWGDPDTWTIACDNPGGWRTSSGDCDDSDEDVNPDAIEVCNDMVDNDCDGEAGDCRITTIELEGTEADVRLDGWAGQGEGGYGVGFVGDVDGDGHGDILTASRSADWERSDDGVVVLTLGGDSGVIDLESSSEAVVYGSATYDYLGDQLKGLGDLDGDGFDDFAVGAPYDGTGYAWLFLGPDVSSGTVDSVADQRIACGYGGYEIEPLADMDSDGLPDFAVGCVSEDTVGAVWIFTDTPPGTFSESTAHAVLTGESAGDYAGAALAGGDNDGDGIVDLVIGAPYHDGAADQAGVVYEVLGPVSGDIDLVDADNRIDGDAENTYFAFRAEGAFDIDADGYDDTALGWYSYADGYLGSLAVFRGGSTGSLDDDPHATMYGSTGQDYVGLGLDTDRDLDQDGYGDLLIGARGWDAGAEDAGAAWLVYGPVTGTIGSRDRVQLLGTTEDALAGWNVSMGGDWDGDGYGDIAVGGYGYDYGGTNNGSTFILFGGGL